MKTITFLKDVKKETKKINWPNKQQILRYTFIVIGALIVVAIFLGICDFIFNIFLKKIILK